MNIRTPLQTAPIGRNRLSTTGAFAGARSRAIPPAAAVAAIALSLVAGTGCQSQHGEPTYVGQKPVGADLFPAPGEPRALDRINETQTAAAARTDATLRPYHFDGTELNSLGQRKLELMTLDDRAFSPLVVYLDLPQDAEQDTRREAVVVYLRDRGLKDDQIRIQSGPNLSPENLHPVGPSLRTLHQLDAGAPIGNNPEPGAVAPAAVGH